MKYVKVEKGVASKPQELSRNPKDKPNTSWTFEQMKLHGFFIVDTSYDQESEYLSDPIITESGVVYVKVKKASEDITKEKIKRKKANIKAKVSDKFFDKNTIFDILVELATLLPSESKIKKDLNEADKKIKLRFKAVNDAVTDVEIDTVDED